MILQRDFENLFGMHGHLLDDRGEPLGVFTLEQHWRDNHVGTSCIPPGDYKYREFSGVKFHDVWEIYPVPGRSAILIHAGNLIKDTHGCVLAGLTRQPDGVGNSRDALMWLRSHVPPKGRFLVRGIPPVGKQSPH